jgi:hypothetical protein
MTVGTKSVLFGAHCFFLHPFLLAWAWTRRHGFPLDPRLWVAFFVHDLGYLGKPNMDGPEGETHPELGARIMHFLFDFTTIDGYFWNDIEHEYMPIYRREFGWHDFCLYHSRFYAKREGRDPSKLCFVDKEVIILTPTWLYVFLTRLTGEILEYTKRATGAEIVGWREQIAWYEDLKKFARGWVAEHVDGKKDEWTSREDESKVFKEKL